MPCGRSGRLIVAAAVVLLVAGCGGPRGVGQQPGGQAGGSSPPGDDLGGLLAGRAGECRLLEAVDGHERPSSADEALGEHVLAGVDAGADLAPLVAVDAGQDAESPVVAGSTVAAVAPMDVDGASSAVWLVEPEASPAITATNKEAASRSAYALHAGVDTTGARKIGHARALARDCAQAAGAPLRDPRPEPSPRMRPELLVVEPDPASPGATVALRFPEETRRGVCFELDRRDGDGWTTRYLLWSDANGGEPGSVPADTEGYGCPDVGVSGSGPDRIRLPAEVAAGRHRICTANAPDDFCAPIEIRAGS